MVGPAGQLPQLSACRGVTSAKRSPEAQRERSSRVRNGTNSSETGGHRRPSLGRPRLGLDHGHHRVVLTVLRRFPQSEEDLRRDHDRCPAAG